MSQFVGTACRVCGRSLIIEWWRPPVCARACEAKNRPAPLGGTGPTSSPTHSLVLLRPAHQAVGDTPGQRLRPFTDLRAVLPHSYERSAADCAARYQVPR